MYAVAKSINFILARLPARQQRVGSFFRMNSYQRKPLRFIEFYLRRGVKQTSSLPLAKNLLVKTTHMMQALALLEEKLICGNYELSVPVKTLLMKIGWKFRAHELPQRGINKLDNPITSIGFWWLINIRFPNA